MNQNQEELLKKYREYDYLNVGKDNPLVKIFVSYIKPSFLFKSEILTPIHLGRAVEKDDSKDGIQNDENLKWLHKNCIGDNDFDGNISHINRRVGFLTGTYWAWKNYEKLGNPEYFGSFGYRKLLSSDCLDDLEKYDLIVPEMQSALPSVKGFLTDLHGIHLYRIIEDIFQKFYPRDFENMQNYFNMNKSYNHEMYIMKKNLFFNYCKWIFPILDYLINLDFSKFQKETDKKNIQQQMFEIKGEARDIAYIIERITLFLLNNLINKNKILYKKCEIVDFIDKKQEKVMAKELMLTCFRNKLKKDLQNQGGHNA